MFDSEDRQVIGTLAVWAVIVIMGLLTLAIAFGLAWRAFQFVAGV
jgi:hypothetical protein